MSVSGILIAESLLKGSPLEHVALQVHKVSRGDVGDVSVGQPLTWTFIEFTVEDQVVADLVGALSRSLDPTGGWYCDFRTAEETLSSSLDEPFGIPVAMCRAGLRPKHTVAPQASPRCSLTGRSNTGGRTERVIAG